MKTILLFLSGYSQAEKRGRDEIMGFARRARWRVQCVSYAQAEASRYSLVKNFGTRDIGGLLDFWKPDGCIVECGAAPRCLQPVDFAGVPAVFLDRDPTTLDEAATCICSDNGKIAAAAFEELWSTGVRNFAYAGWYSPVYWSRQRQEAFAAILASRGCKMHALDTRIPSRRTASSNARLLSSLRAMPRPLAVFAANDLVAEHVVSVCCNNGISIPNDVVVVGVDNLEDVCENAVVSISSVPQDYDGSGRIACECLDRMLANPSARPETRHIGVGKVVRRASTRALGSDKRVVAALEFIRVNAVLGIDVGDVVKSMGCSRRTADMLFRTFCGHSILHEITEVRVERVKALLSDSQMSVSAISDTCGFSSINDLDRVFGRYAGVSPRAWRERR